MKIAVIGSGAIGGLVAGYLENSGEDVFLTGHKESVEAINKNRLNIIGVRGNFKVQIEAKERLDKNVDLAIFAVKTQDIKRACEENLRYIKEAVILTVQNGIRSDMIIAQDIAKEKIISSIVMFGSTYLDTGEIVHNFEGKWILGRPFVENDDVLTQINEILNKAFETVISEDILGMKWLKIFVNANNCLPAIIGRSMQETFGNLELCKISMRIWQEGLKIIEKSGIRLVSLPDFPLERLLKLAAMPIGESSKIFSGIMINLSKEPLYGSILQSIKRGRASEIDYINGEFVALARENRMTAPLNEKLVELVHNIEKYHKFVSQEELVRIVDNL